MLLSRKVYRSWFGDRIFGFLTQAGTAAPTAVTKNKSIAGTFTWARTGAGVYTLTGPAGSFPANRTVVKGGVYDQLTGKTLTGTRTSDTVITFNHGVAGGAASDVFSGVPFEIVVFPA